MKLDKVKQKLTEKSFLILFLLIVVVTIVRPLFIPQDVLFTYYGIGSGTLTGLIYLYLSNTPSHNWHPYLFAVVSLCLLLPLIVISGGVNSHFATMVPLMPVLFFIIASRRAAQGFSVLLMVFVAALYVSNDLLPSHEALNASHTATDMQALWLLLSVLVGMVFGSEFDKMSRALGTKILESDATDELTRLNSRLNVLENLENRIEMNSDSKEWLSVYVVDIDHFKSINESFGRDVADDCLREVAKLIQFSVRGKGDLVGRYGEDEFLMVLEGVDQSAAHHIAEKVRQLIEEREISSEGVKVELTATIGFCSLPYEHIHSTEQLLQAAHMALSVGQKAGRNQVVGSDQAMVTSEMVVNS